MIKRTIFYKIKGFNYKKNSEKSNNENYIMVLIDYAKFEFYVKGKHLDEHMCDFNLFNDRSNFFGSIEYLQLRKAIKYSTRTCPYAFLNSNIRKLFLDQITNSLIYKNRLEFIEINKPDGFSLNNKELDTLILSCTYENVTLRLLNKFIFKYISELYLTGIISGIQTDLFLYFKNLGVMTVSIENLVYLLSNDNKWISYLNCLINVNLTDTAEIRKNVYNAFFLKIIQTDFVAGATLIHPKIYKYPDEDFCLFRYFPHYRIVYPVISTTVKLECTCTIVWLIKYATFYLNPNYTDVFLNEYESLDGYNPISNLSVTHCRTDMLNRLKACDFTKKKEVCNKSNFNKKEDSFQIQFNNDTDLVFLVKWLELVIFMFIQPIFCFLSLITNALTILLLRMKFNKKKTKENMYQHILVNSVFNLVYCAFNLFKIINVCVFDLTSYCSPIYQAKGSQYFYLYGILFFGNALKICSNFSFLSFSFSRLLLSSYTSSPFYNRFVKFNLYCYYSAILAFSLLISLFKIFEYQINEIYLSVKSFPYEKYDIGNCEKSDFTCMLFRVLNILNDFMKNVLIIFLNAIIDIILFKNSKENLKIKKKLTTDDDKLAPAIELKNKLNRMIFINGIIFIIAYLPEFSAYIILNVYEKELNIFCMQYMSCREFTEFAQIFNYVSFFLQFFVLKKFNRNFNEKYVYLKNEYFWKKLKCNKIQKKQTA